MHLMVTIDGAEHALVPLKDGDDRFNAEAERGALDRAYEAKESNPESVVAVVLAWHPDDEREYLTISYDVTDLDPDQRQWLAGAAEAQAEGGDGDADYPAVDYTVRWEQRAPELSDDEFMAESLDLLADLDEGEHTDAERLRLLARQLRRRVTSAETGTADEADEATKLGIQPDTPWPGEEAS